MFATLLLSCVLSADPVVVIDAPDTAQVFTPVPFDFGKSSTGLYEFSITPKPPYIDRASNAKHGVFLGPPGKYTLSLDVIVFPSGKLDGEIVRVSGSKVVEITGSSPPAPPPPPGPVPPAPPTPDIPSGKYGLAKIAFDAGMSIAPAARAKSPAVAACCRQIAADVYDQKLSLNMLTASTISKRLDESFGADDKAAWKPWKSAVRQKLDSLGSSKELPGTPLAVSTAFEEIAVGVSLVK